MSSQFANALFRELIREQTAEGKSLFPWEIIHQVAVSFLFQAENVIYPCYRKTIITFKEAKKSVLVPKPNEKQLWDDAYFCYVSMLKEQQL